MAQELTQERLKELLHYDPETGIFTWRVSRGKVKVGGVAGTTTVQGYKAIVIDRVQYRAHRLAWLYVYGAMPEGMVDHRDRDTWNNRIDNLRIATFSQNALNSDPPANNTSGHKGVYWERRHQRWFAKIMVDHQIHHLGSFHTIQEAITARKAGEAILGVSEFCQ